MSEFKREDRYIVLKRKDVSEHLTDAEQMILSLLSAKVDQGRAFAGKPIVDRVVVESDWPEYEQTWSAIEQRVGG